MVPSIPKNDPDVLEFLKANTSEKLTTLYLMLREGILERENLRERQNRIEMIVFRIVLPALVGVGTGAVAAGVLA